MATIHLAISIPLFLVGSLLAVYSWTGQGFSPGLSRAITYCAEYDCDMGYFGGLVVQLLIGISMIIIGIFVAKKISKKPDA